MNKAKNVLQIGNKSLGDSHPVYIIAEIGINHNGDLSIAKQLIDVAKASGCDAVKFQKRTPELCVPMEQREILRETPWGVMTYFEYKKKIEFGYDEYAEIDQYCKQLGIDWFASCWDIESVRFIEQFNPIAYKLASATITDVKVLESIAATRKPVLMSTGMSTMEEIRFAVSNLPYEQLALFHTTSCYPCKSNEINLRMIDTLKDEFNRPVGYSGHEIGLQITLAAVALGANMVERHITLNRAMWGTDQSASVEPQGLTRLVRDIRIIEEAMGDGIKHLYDCEQKAREKLRWIK